MPKKTLIVGTSSHRRAAGSGDRAPRHYRDRIDPESQVQCHRCDTPPERIAHAVRDLRHGGHRAEGLGYDSVWVTDSQMIFSDCYAVLALAARQTRRIRLGPGTAICGTRIPPVHVAAMATLNRLAPGRVHLGIGTGNTALRSMGQRPMRVAQYAVYL